MFSFLVVGFAAATPLIKDVITMDQLVEDETTFAGKFIIIRGVHGALQSYKDNHGRSHLHDD